MDKSLKRNMQIPLKAFDTLFNRRDYATAERFWSPSYIQHGAHIPGRDGLFNLIKAMPDTQHCENHIAAASGDFIILHGRFSGLGQRAAWVVDDIVRRLAPFGNVEIGPIGVLRLPAIAHLITPIFFAESGTEKMMFADMQSWTNDRLSVGTR